MRSIIVMGVAVCLLAGQASAQESVSTDRTQGDLLWPYDVASQRTDFVVDLHPFETLSGQSFYIAPILRPSRTDSEHSNSYISAQGISRTQLLGTPFAADSYALWNEAGRGVNPATNTSPQSNVDAAAWLGTQFAVGFADFALATTNGTPSGANNIVTGVVNLRPDEPGRAYISRIVAATNGDSETENRSQFGFGSIDANGNVHFRADDHGVSGPEPLLGNNLFRTSVLARNFAATNLIDIYGATDGGATDWLLQYHEEVHNPPNIIPEQVAGRPVLLTGNFSIQYVYEQNAGSVTSNRSHAGPLVGLPLGDPEGELQDHRGSLAFTPLLHADANAVGTAAMLAKYGSEYATDNITVWQVSPNGQSIDPFAFELPETLVWTIPETSETGVIGDGYLASEGYGPAFDHYHSQTAFRGGAAQIALGSDQQGRGLIAAATYDHSTGYDTYSNPYQAIPVARFDQADPTTVEWTVAAFIDQLEEVGPNPPFARNRPPSSHLNHKWRGSPIYDADGVEIGQLSPWYSQYVAFDGAVSGTPADYGPSMSAPAMDAVGNIYFISSVQLYSECPEPPEYDPATFDQNNPETWYWTGSCDIALVRAVYDPASFSYTCEVVLRLGDEFPGLNSATPYKISYLALADNDSIDSGSLWSGNVMQDTVDGIDRTTLSTGDPLVLGGLVFQAGIIYDTDGDGDFNADLDQEYDVLMLLRGRASGCSNETITADNLSAFVACVAGPELEPVDECVCSDLDGDGDVDLSDLAELQRRFVAP